jgi:glucose-6-phosphate isomerase
LPSDIGGRYSVLTAVGLLPLAVAGIDIDDLMAGALKARSESVDNLDHDLYKYAVIRDTLYRQNYKSELYVVYEPQYAMFNEWLKQLYGESEGKEKKGLFPTSVTFSTDLHSLGQFIQDGSPILFETTLFVENPNQDVVIPSEKENLDELNYLAGKNLAFVNKQAFKGTLAAHVEDGKVPNLVFEIATLDAHTLGYMFYFFMRSCAVSAYLLDINPFNQPGVEVYKKNMFALLGKPSRK